MAASMKMTVFWDTAPCALMVEAASTSETSVNFYQTTWHNIPEDNHLHTRHHENLKSNPILVIGWLFSEFKHLVNKLR
jgi:hypothetical protein